MMLFIIDLASHLDSISMSNLLLIIRDSPVRHLDFEGRPGSIPYLAPLRFFKPSAV